MHHKISGKSASMAFGQRRIPSWNTSGRPKNPKVGTLGFNMETDNLEFWNGSLWLKLPMEKIE